MSLEVVIYLCDNSSKTFTLPNGYVTTSQEYFNLMIKALKLPENLGKKCFALWLKSPLLGLFFNTLSKLKLLFKILFDRN